MRKNLVLSCMVLFVLLSFSLAVSVEAASISWAYSYETEFDSSRGTSVVATSDGGYAVAGSLNSHASLFKTDAYGNMEWNKTYEGIWNDHFYSLVATSDGGYAIAGETKFDFWLVKTDASGNMEWNQSIGGGVTDVPESLVEANDGGYVIVGSISDLHWIVSYILLVKTDETGYVPDIIIPEYNSWLIPSLLLAATLVIVIYKERLFQVHENTKN